MNLVGGVATVTITYVGTISDTITATYAGDSNFNGSTGPLTGNPQVVNPAGTTTALISSQNPSTFNQAVTFTATVTKTGGPGTPTGTVTFKDGATTLNTVNLVAGLATFTSSSLTPGSHSLMAIYNGDANFTGSNGSVTQSVGTIGTSTALASTPNPSFAGQAVTFTATVTKSGGSGTPTGTVTFKDGGSTLGAGTLNGASAASFTTSALSTGRHSISAVYGGDANFSVSTSAALSQAVNLPADSIKLRALQIQATKLEAQGSGQAVAGTIDSVISEGFAQTDAPVSANDNGVHFNFSADPQPQEKEKTFEERSGGAFSALGYDNDPVKAAPRPIPREWLFWADVRGTDWSTNQQTGDIRGGQTNGFLGLTHKLSPDFLVGAFGGMEVFNYSSQLLAGHLKGNGWTSGGYLALRLLPGLRLDLGGSYSGIGYDGVSGMASGSFPGQRWLATAALVGTIKTMPGFEIESSARAYGLWEHETAYTDSLGTAQGERNFSTGRARAGTKVSYPWMWAASVTVAPYVGGFADYYFNKDDAALPVAAPILLPTEFVHGWSGRVTSGAAVKTGSGAQFTVGGELGGLGSNQFTNWTVRGQASLPF